MSAAETPGHRRRRHARPPRRRRGAGRAAGRRRHRPRRGRPHRSPPRPRTPWTSTCPRPSCNCAAWTDVDGAGARGRGAARQRRRRRQPRRGRRELGARLVHVSTDYVFDGTLTGAALRRVRPDRPARRLRAHEARGRGGGGGARPPTTRSCAPPGCSAPAATSFETMLRLGAERDEVAGGRPTRSAARRGPATSRPRCSTSPPARRQGVPAPPAPGRAPGTSWPSSCSAPPA